MYMNFLPCPGYSGTNDLLSQAVDNKSLAVRLGNPSSQAFKGLGMNTPGLGFQTLESSISHGTQVCQFQV